MADLANLSAPPGGVQPGDYVPVLRPPAVVGGATVPYRVPVPADGSAAVATEAAARAAADAALAQAVAGKAAAAHSHAIAEVTGLQAALDGKAAAVSGGAGTAYGTIVPLTDAATVTPSAAALTGPTDLFGWTLGGNRTLAAPTGVPSGKAQSVGILFRQDGTGGRTVALGSGITPAKLRINGAPNAVALVTFTTLDGGATWIHDGDPGVLDLMDGASIATDASIQDTFAATLGGNRTLANPTGLRVGGTYAWMIDQDATGGRTLAFGSMFKFSGNSTLAAGAGAKSLLTAIYDGAVLRSTLNGPFA